jgi:hypothetical protein
VNQSQCHSADGSLTNIVVINYLFILLIYYLCAESTATRSVTDTAQCKYMYYIMARHNKKSRISCRKRLMQKNKQRRKLIGKNSYKHRTLGLQSKILSL